MLFASASDLRIPVVDMNDYADPNKREAFLDTLFDALSEVGFFAVRHTGVDGAVLKKGYAEAEAFFRQDGKTKQLCYDPTLNGQRGFVAGEIAKGHAAKDRKEFYHIGKEDSLPKNIWPKNTGFRAAMMALYGELDRYVVPLQEAIVAALNQRAGTDLPLDLLHRETRRGDSLLRALYYPAMASSEIGQAPLYWAAPHTDIDLLAILPYATERGLQVELNGQWQTVVVPPDAFIVNAGDMLENLTNGLFISAKHRVMALEPDKDRFSMVLFVHPHDASRLDPLPACVALTGGVQRYAPGTRNEFLWERLIELNIAPGLLQPYAQTGHVERQVRFGRQSPQVVEMLIERGLASEELLDALGKIGH